MVYVFVTPVEVVLSRPPKKCIESFGGEVLITKKKHINGTSRASEAVKNIDCTHVLLLQGDEPLILPRNIDYFLKQIS